MDEEPIVTVKPKDYYTSWSCLRNLLPKVPKEFNESFRGVRGSFYDGRYNMIVLGDNEEPSEELLAHTLSHEYLHYIFERKWNDEYLSRTLDEIRKKSVEIALLI